MNQKNSVFDKNLYDATLDYDKTEKDLMGSLLPYVKKNYKIKGGMIDGKVVSAEDLLVLAQLPSKEELLSKLAGSLLGIITKLAVAVDQVRIKKEEEAE